MDLKNYAFPKENQKNWRSVVQNFQGFCDIFDPLKYHPAVLFLRTQANNSLKQMSLFHFVRCEFILSHGLNPCLSTEMEGFKNGLQ